MGMTDADARIILDQNFDNLETDTYAIYDVIIDGIDMKTRTSYSMDAHMNTYEFYQQLVQMELMRYIEINLSSSNYRYQIELGAMFDTYDVANAFENNDDISS